MGDLTGLLEWFSDKESQQSLCLVIKISRGVESNLHSEEPVSMLDIWSCSYGTAVPYSTTLWIRNSNIHSVWVSGVNSWHSGMSCSSRKSGKHEHVVLCQPLGGLQHHWEESCSAVQCLRVGRPRLSVVSFAMSINKSKLTRDHFRTKDNYPQQDSTGMSFVDKKVCYETLSVLSMSIFPWHMNFQHPVLCEITAIFLQAPINSDEL